MKLLNSNNFISILTNSSADICPLLSISIKLKIVDNLTPMPGPLDLSPTNIIAIKTIIAFALNNTLEKSSNQFISYLHGGIVSCRQKWYNPCTIPKRKFTELLKIRCLHFEGIIAIYEVIDKFHHILPRPYSKSINGYKSNYFTFFYGSKYIRKCINRIWHTHFDKLLYFFLIFSVSLLLLLTTYSGPGFCRFRGR